MGEASCTPTLAPGKGVSWGKAGEGTAAKTLFPDPGDMVHQGLCGVPGHDSESSPPCLPVSAGRCPAGLRHTQVRTTLGLGYAGGPGAMGSSPTHPPCRTHGQCFELNITLDRAGPGRYSACESQPLPPVPSVTCPFSHLFPRPPVPLATCSLSFCPFSSQTG